VVALFCGLGYCFLPADALGAAAGLTALAATGAGAVCLVQRIKESLGVRVRSGVKAGETPTFPVLASKEATGPWASRPHRFLGAAKPPHHSPLSIVPTPQN